MIIFIDTNIVLDVVLKREMFYKDSHEVLKKIIKNKIDAYVSASCITDIFYIAKKVLKDSVSTKATLVKLLSFIDVVNITKGDILKALKMDIDDFEDALQIQCAMKVKAIYFITRDRYINIKNIEIITPELFLKQGMLDK